VILSKKLEKFDKDSDNFTIKLENSRKDQENLNKIINNLKENCEKIQKDYQTSKARIIELEQNNEELINKLRFFIMKNSILSLKIDFPSQN